MVTSVSLKCRRKLTLAVHILREVSADKNRLYLHLKIAGSLLYYVRKLMRHIYQVGLTLMLMCSLLCYIRKLRSVYQVGLMLKITLSAVLHKEVNKHLSVWAEAKDNVLSAIFYVRKLIRVYQVGMKLIITCCLLYYIRKLISVYQLS